MKPIRSLIALVGAAAIAATALLVHELRAADPQGIAKIVAAIKAGKMADAKAAAKEYAKNNDDVEDLMSGFGKKGLLGGGIGKKIETWDTKGIPAAELIAPDNVELGVTAAAIALVCDALPAPKGQQENPAQWTAFAKDLSDKGVKFQTAFKAKVPAEIQRAAGALNATCTNCHAKFR
jgi:hypothetical protein